MPGRPQPNLDILEAQVSKKSYPLQLAFDLTVSPQFAPILLCADQVSLLRERFLGKSEENLYRWFERTYEWLEQSRPDYFYSQMPTLVEGTVRLVEEYEKAFGGLAAKLDAKAESLTQRGCFLPGFDRREALSVLGEMPIHIGSGAEKANQPLVNVIENNLFVRDLGRVYFCDFSALKGFSFPPQSFAAIEKQTPASETDRFLHLFPQRMQRTANGTIRPER